MTRNIKFEVGYQNMSSAEVFLNEVHVAIDDPEAIRKLLLALTTPDAEIMAETLRSAIESEGQLREEMVRALAWMAFDKLGWHDVQIDFISLEIDGLVRSISNTLEESDLEDNLLEMDLVRIDGGAELYFIY